MTDKNRKSEVSAANSKTYREITEGMVKKGGVNSQPSTPRPEPPKAQTHSDTSASPSRG